MKNRLFKLALSLTLVVVSLFTFSACDLFDNATDVTITKDFETSLTVIPGEAIDLEKKISLEDDSEIAKYKDRLKEVVVEGASYHVEDYQGDDDAIVNGEAMFMGNTGNGLGYTFDNVSLKAATTPVSFGLEGQELTQLATHFKNDKEATFTVDGTLDHGPNFAGCKLVVTLTLKITAEAL